MSVRLTSCAFAIFACLVFPSSANNPSGARQIPSQPQPSQLLSEVQLAAIDNPCVYRKPYLS
jgi:hypothetical protein